MSDGIWNIKLVHVKDSFDPSHLKDAIDVYRNVFARAPYFEYFEHDDVATILNALLHKGTIIIAILDDRVVGLIGGYELVPKVSYYIDEFAVDVACQGKGIGTHLLKQFIDTISKEYHQLELRTSHVNIPALRMYKKYGFIPTARMEWVPQYRQDGKLSLDKRVHLFNDFKLNQVAIASPSGNVTAIVFDEDIGYDRSYLQSQISKNWDNNHPDQVIEQCCFVKEPNDPKAIARVEMFGGEFCGNAARSVIWTVTGGKNYHGYIEVTGVSSLLEFEVSDGVVTLEMPIPTSSFISEVDEGILVRLNGITHLVCSTPVSEEYFKQMIQNNTYGLGECPAAGLCTYNSETSKATFLVWVKSIKTLFHETACGSGSCAIGCALTYQSPRSEIAECRTYTIVQPTGENINVHTTSQSDLITYASISGRVQILHKGSLSLK